MAWIKKYEVDSPTVPLEEETSAQGTIVEGSSEESDDSSDFSQQILDFVAATNALAPVEEENAEAKLGVTFFIFICICIYFDLYFYLLFNRC